MDDTEFKTYEEVIELFFRNFQYEEKEIKDLIDDMNKTKFPDMKKFIYYIIEIMTANDNYCGLEFDNMKIILNCKYANILQFSCSKHDKVIYSFISKICKNNNYKYLFRNNRFFFSDAIFFITTIFFIT